MELLGLSIVVFMGCSIDGLWVLSSGLPSELVAYSCRLAWVYGRSQAYAGLKNTVILEYFS